MRASTVERSDDRNVRAHERDHTWLGDVITKHYHGDDSDVKVLMGGILQAFAEMTVDDYGNAARSRRRAMRST
jgi:hypothetical protein